MVRRQDPALDALLVWLNDEPAHVERLMKTPQGIAQLCVVMEVKHMGTFSNMLNALSQIVYKSTVINRALGKVDPSLSASPFVTALIRRLSSNGLERRSHPLDALVRRLLLTILTEIYRKHQEPKQLVKLHHLSALLKGDMAPEPESLPALLVSPHLGIASYITPRTRDVIDCFMLFSECANRY